jgi:hypothetical protein
MNSSQIYCVVKYWDNIEINIPSSSKPVVNKETTPTIEIQIISEHGNSQLIAQKISGTCYE